MSITVDDSTQASNPGQLQISIDKYADYYGVSGFGKSILKFYSSMPVGFKKLICKWSSTAFQFVSTQEKFEYGAINPALVIDKKKGLVAVFTSLTSIGTVSYPVIKIYREQLNLIDNVTVDNGTKLATVALYYQSPSNPNPNKWMDFMPQVPNCFVNDKYACNRMKASIKEEAWEALHYGLKQIPELKEGLYNLELDNDLVQSAY